MSDVNVVLSVVIPNYNFKDFLAELLMQLNSLDNRNRLEIIVVDGGSTDGSIIVARSLLKPHDKLLYGPDSGQSHAISKGLSVASGRWFMFQNSDDLFDIKTLDALLEEIALFNEYDVLAFGQDFLEYDGASWLSRSGFRHFFKINWRQLVWSIYFTNQATLYDRVKSQSIGFDSEKKFAMDYDFVVRFFKKIKPKVRYFNSVLGLQRLHSVTKTSTMQDVCIHESKDIVHDNFSIFDRLVGYCFAFNYHFFKYVFRVRKNLY